MYFNDELEADPMSWEEHLFDEAEAAYERMDRMKERWDNAEMVDYPSTPYDNMFAEEYILTKHWFKTCFDDCAITEEQWKKMVTWSKRNYKEKKEWFNFCAMHRLNLSGEDGEFLREEWGDDELFKIWEQWIKLSPKNRIDLLDGDAIDFEILYRIDYKYRKGLLKWTLEHPYISEKFNCYIIKERRHWYDSESRSNHLDLKYTLQHWITFLFFYTLYSLWERSASILDISILETEVLSTLNNDLESGLKSKLLNNGESIERASYLLHSSQKKLYLDDFFLDRKMNYFLEHHPEIWGEMSGVSDDESLIGYNDKVYDVLGNCVTVPKGTSFYSLKYALSHS